MYLVFYNGEHSITFGGEWQFEEDSAELVGGYHSWEDWHLVPTTKAGIAPPTVKVKQVDIPGVNGMLDLSSVLTGYPVYNNRTGSFSYIVAPGYGSFEAIKSEIMNAIQGRIMKLYLDDDPGYYYQGMVWVNDAKSDASSNTISISYDLYPFKKPIVSSTDDWLWDPFNFDEDYIHDYSALVVDGELELDIDDCTEPVSPTFTASAQMSLEHIYWLSNGSIRSKQYTLASGESTPGVTLRPGSNILYFEGNGTVGVSYRSGRL